MLTGRHFLQLPGPTNSPLAVLAATARPPIDHRGPEFQKLSLDILGRIGRVFGTKEPVVIYAASGTGGWEAALMNTCSPGDRLLMFETGQFAALWQKLAAKLGLEPEYIASDWRQAVDPAAIEAHLREDRGHKIRAVCVVHNETSTGIASDIPAIRAAMDRAGHPALLLVDTISGLGAIPYQHDAWGVDVTICGSQKGLMLPPGLAFNVASKKAREAAKSAKMPRAYWDWEDMITPNANGWYPWTPASNLFMGLQVALDMLEAEGLDNVIARHARAGEATRRCVRHWGLDIVPRSAAHASNAVTAVYVPEGHSADNLRKIVLQRSNMSLGSGLGRLADRVFRIGHLGDFNDPMITGTLASVEAGMAEARIPFNPGGVTAALAYMQGNVR